MSMTKEAIKKFVEEDYKDFAILVTCDNEHHFYHNVAGNAPVIWDWDNNVFYALDTNDVVNDQNKHPMQVSMVSLDEIQFLDAFIDMNAALKFINEKITDEAKREEVKQKVLRKVAPSMMGPRTLDGKNLGDF